MKFDETDHLSHYGILRRSGRYPWGSGGYNETQRSKHFLDYVEDLKKQGLSESVIAQGFGMSIKALRASKSVASNQQRQANVVLAQRLKDKGWSNTAIAKRMNVSDNTVKSYLAPGAKDKADVLTSTSNALKSHIKKDVYLDVGKGVEIHMGVSRTRLDTAIEMLKMEGYELISLRSPQATTGFNTNQKVLAMPGTTWAEAHHNRDRIVQITKFSDDGGRTYGSLHEPLSIDKKRVDVVYGPDGGDKADGMIYVRPNVSDVSIGGAKYAQVRVAVGKDHFLKGMAMYKDDLPPGVDVQFYTNKKDSGNKLDAMKKNTEDPAYLEGGPHPMMKSVKRQILADPDTPNEHVTSAMNIVNEEGNWEDWADNLSSQMLSKQSPVLAKTQLKMTYDARQNQFDELSKLTNPTVRKKMLMDFADATDASAVHLEAAALPHIGNHVILPVSSMKSTEIYAPNYNQGQKVVLIRHPHAGVFEIPELIVNNNNREAKRLLGQSRDAVGINHEVAQWLSGADFDGDTVLVIPNDKELIRHSRPLDELKNFDPRSSYPSYPGMKPIGNMQHEMGMISNLITDMSLKKAPHADLARAVKHSMVVIDSEKHNLDHKLSYNDNGIKQLKQKYQAGGGASSLISRAGAETRIPQRKPRLRSHGGPIDTKTGALRYEPTGRIGYKSGKPVTEKVKRLSVTDNARDLMSTRSGTPMERIYADHSNKLKSLANQARLLSINTPNHKQSSSAKKAYAHQVASLDSKLEVAERNAPLERQAQLIAGATVKARREANPNMDEATEKKIRYQALSQARVRTGASKIKVVVEPEEWNAIQAGAISHSKLTRILNNADMNSIRSLATPKTERLMTPIKTQRARQMIADGYSEAQVAAHLGVSLTTLTNAL